MSPEILVQFVLSLLLFSSPQASAPREEPLQPPPLLVVDRIEATWAVLDGPGAEPVVVPVVWLPPRVREGDGLYVLAGDPRLVEQRRVEGARRLQRLRARADAKVPLGDQ